MRKILFVLSLLAFLGVESAFAIERNRPKDRPPITDTLKNPRTGELYWIQVAVYGCYDKNPESPPAKGFGLSGRMTYRLEPYPFEKKEFGWWYRKESEQNAVKSCPEGWTKKVRLDTIHCPKIEVTQYAHCELYVPITPPLTFRLDTGENRMRRVSKAERDSVLKLCEEDAFHVLVGQLLGGTGSGDKHPINHFVYIDKTGKVHSVELIRQYKEDLKRVVSQLFYPLDSGKCDKGWAFVDNSKWRARYHSDFYKDRCTYDLPEPEVFKQQNLPKKHTPPLKAKPTLPKMW